MGSPPAAAVNDGYNWHCLIWIFFLSDGQKIHFLYPPSSTLIFGRRLLLLLESLCERVPTSQHSPAHRSSKGRPSAPNTRRMYRYTSELALFFLYNKGGKCIDDGHDLSDTARLSVSVRLLTQNNNCAADNTVGVHQQQPAKRIVLLWQQQQQQQTMEKRSWIYIYKNWAGPPLFPCRWIGVSFNSPARSNIVRPFSFFLFSL